MADYLVRLAGNILDSNICSKLQHAKLTQFQVVVFKTGKIRNYVYARPSLPYCKRVQ